MCSVFSTKISKEQFIPTNGNWDSRPGKIFACRIWNLGIFLTNPKSWALESRISLSRLESGNVIQVPKTRNLELIQYLEYRMNDMKYRIQDYLGLTYSNYHVSFCFEFDFQKKKKKKKSWTGWEDFLKNLSHIFICFVLSVWALFSIDHFHPHGQLQCQFIGTKESVYILKKTVKLAQDILGTLTWPSFHCFGTPIWPSWLHVKTLHILQDCCEQLSHHFQCTLIYCYLNVNLPFN